MRSFNHRQEVVDTTKEHYFLLFGTFDFIMINHIYILLLL